MSHREVASNFVGVIRQIGFPTGRPRIHVFRFHISSSEPYQIDQDLVDQDRDQIDQSLQRAGICSSVDELNTFNKLLLEGRRESFLKEQIWSRFNPRRLLEGIHRQDESVDTRTGDIVYPRVARFIQNYVRAGILMREGTYRPRMVIAGRSGLYNALAVEAIGFKQGLCLVYEEARAIEDARKGNPILRSLRPIDDSRGALESPDSDAPLHTSALERFLGEFQGVVDELEFTKDSKIMIIDAEGNQLATFEEIRKEITRQAIRPYDEEACDKKLSLLGIPRPLEVGLEPKGGKTKYVIGATVLGIGGIMAILALRRYQSRKLPKKGFFSERK